MRSLPILIFLIATIIVSANSCTSKKVSNALAVDQKTSSTNNRFTNELIIQFNEEVDIDSWQTAYKKYGVQLKKPLSKAAKIYLFIFDANTVNTDQALELFNQDKVVKAVELNKKAQPR